MNEWCVYVQTEDLEASVAKGKELGAKVFKEIDRYPGGGTAVLQDPNGGLLGLHTSGMIVSFRFRCPTRLAVWLSPESFVFSVYHVQYCHHNIIDLSCIAFAGNFADLLQFLIAFAGMMVVTEKDPSSFSGLGIPVWYEYGTDDLAVDEKFFGDLFSWKCDESPHFRGYTRVARTEAVCVYT